MTIATPTANSTPPSWASASTGCSTVFLNSDIRSLIVRYCDCRTRATLCRVDSVWHSSVKDFHARQIKHLAKRYPTCFGKRPKSASFIIPPFIVGRHPNNRAFQSHFTYTPSLSSAASSRQRGWKKRKREIRRVGQGVALNSFISDRLDFFLRQAGSTGGLDNQRRRNSCGMRSDSSSISKATGTTSGSNNGSVQVLKPIPRSCCTADTIRKCCFTCCAFRHAAFLTDGFFRSLQSLRDLRVFLDVFLFHLFFNDERANRRILARLFMCLARRSRRPIGSGTTYVIGNRDGGPDREDGEAGAVFPGHESGEEPGNDWVMAAAIVGHCRDVSDSDEGLDYKATTYSFIHTAVRHILALDLMRPTHILRILYCDVLSSFLLSSQLDPIEKLALLDQNVEARRAFRRHKFIDVNSTVICLEVCHSFVDEWMKGCRWFEWSKRSALGKMKKELWGCERRFMAQMMSLMVMV